MAASVPGSRCPGGGYGALFYHPVRGGCRPTSDGGDLRSSLPDFGGGSDHHSGAKSHGAGIGGQNRRRYAGGPVPGCGDRRQAGPDGSNRSQGGCVHGKPVPGYSGAGAGRSGRQTDSRDRKRPDGAIGSPAAAAKRSRCLGDAENLPPRGNDGSPRLRHREL